MSAFIYYAPNTSSSYHCDSLFLNKSLKLSLVMGRPIKSTLGRSFCPIGPSETLPFL